MCPERSMPTTEVIGIKVIHTGIVEACYNSIMADELMKFAANGMSADAIEFTCAINHLLLRKAGMTSKLAKVASIKDGSLPEQMDQVHDTYVKPNFRSWGCD